MQSPSLGGSPVVHALRGADGWDVVHVSTDLPGASAGNVWQHAITFAGVNTELWPVLRMRKPRAMAADNLDEVPLCVPQGRAWLLLGGVLPVDYDDLTLVERTTGRRFLERSKTRTARVWQHERIVEPTSSGARVTDEVRYMLRGPASLIRPVYRLAIAALFKHRHKQLWHRFARRPPDLAA